jgi:hypothetical protein
MAITIASTAIEQSNSIKENAGAARLKNPPEVFMALVEIARWL